MNPNISYAVSINNGSSSFNNYVNTPINGPLSTNRYPGIIPKSFLGILPTIKQTPQQFYSGQSPPYSNQKTNMRLQYKRTAISTPQRIQQYIAAKKTNPNAYWTPSTGNAFATSQHTNYISPIPSSMLVNIKKSIAVGKSSYGVGLSTNTPMSTKSYFPTDVRTHLRRVRNAGTVAPKKKGSIYNTGLYNSIINVYPPRPPYIYNCVLTDEYLYIYFNAGNDGGMLITNYQYSIDGGSTFITLSPLQTNSPIIILNTFTSTINIAIRGINSIGIGDISNIFPIYIYSHFIYSFTNVNNISDSNILSRIPINNTAGLFTYLQPTITKGASNLVTVDIAFEYVINLSITAQLTNGLTFFPNSSYYNTNMQNLNIIQFDGIPLARRDIIDTFTRGRQFQSLTNLTISAIDTPTILSNTSLEFAFNGATNFNSNINNWNTSGVISLASCFTNTLFNQPLNNWDVSNVTNLTNMFSGCSQFNQPLDNWDVSKVTTLVNLFNSAVLFNQNINNWDVSNVTTLTSAFNTARAFNQPLNNWNTSKVTSLSATFSQASSFNQNINTWDTSKVTLMSATFSNATIFNQPLNNWNTSNVTTMSNMFSNARAFNQPINNWNTSKVTTMSNMFNGSSSFNQNISYNSTNNTWNTSLTTAMLGMFSFATVFNNGELANVGITSPLGWITSPLSGVLIPVSAFATGSGLTRFNSANYQNISIITGLPPT